MDHHWTERPTALQQRNYAEMSRGELMEHYKADNEKAQKHVTIPPRPQPRTNQLRVCQWNVHCFSHWDSGKKSVEFILEEVCRNDPDIVVINEFSTFKWVRPKSAAAEFCREMILRGYKDYKIAKTSYSTAVFTRLVAKSITTTDLGDDRHVVGMCLAWPKYDRYDKDGKNDIWVFGTHLNHAEYFPGHRSTEMKQLIQHAEQSIGGDFLSSNVLIVGDFNQQREQDYTAEEWRKICESKQRRNEASVDDGVASLLQDHGFVCAWDNDEDPKQKLKSNKQYSLPPASHWTGTAIDYAYGSQSLRNVGTYVSPSGLSDHRLIVTDWTIR